MVMGKHNFIVAHSANLMARRLKNALVAPTIQYVPEGDPDRQNPGAISLPSPAYDMLLDAAARSLKAHGATEILFIGDSGGNQQGMRDVAAKLNEEWKGGTTQVYALTDYYEGGREHYRAWMEAAFGYTDDIIGSHAGISDTSQMLHVKPAGVRKDQHQAVGRSEGFGRVRRSDEGDRGDRPHGHRVQDQRGAESVQAVEEPAAAARWQAARRASSTRRRGALQLSLTAGDVVATRSCKASGQADPSAWLPPSPTRCSASAASSPDSRFHPS